MAGLFSDARKTALGACALLVLAVLFADPSGVGGSAVSAQGSGAARPVPAPTPASAPAPSPAKWFAAGEAEPDPVFAAPGHAGPPLPPPLQPGEVRPPPPVGPDFPPGQTRGG